MIEAVIFDMDGLMVDTESFYTQAITEVANKRGREFTLKLKQEMMGRQGIESMTIFKEQLELEETPLELLEERSKIFGGLLNASRIEPLPGLLKLLDELRKEGIRRAIASSSKRCWIEIIVSRFGLDGEFEVIVSGDDVRYGKPDPEIYLLTARRLGLSPENCLVLEDAPVGVIAAKKAGMYCIVCPNQFSQGLDFSLADTVVNSLEDVTLNLITNLTES
ncbi:TPA: hypothetical protein DCX15_06435 [bacterium]|nr:hypothetical protein [bacterium]